MIIKWMNIVHCVNINNNEQDKDKITDCSFVNEKKVCQVSTSEKKIKWKWKIFFSPKKKINDVSETHMTSNVGSLVLCLLPLFIQFYCTRDIHLVMMMITHQFIFVFFNKKNSSNNKKKKKVKTPNEIEWESEFQNNEKKEKEELKKRMKWKLKPKKNLSKTYTIYEHYEWMLKNLYCIHFETTLLYSTANNHHHHHHRPNNTISMVKI